MPAMNMAGVVASNPSTGRFVMMSPFSGPSGSPLDAVAINPTSGARTKDANNLSTGALNTGIGFGAQSPIFGTLPSSLKAIQERGFSDDYTPGVTLPNGNAATTAILTAIGGGKSTANVNGIAPTVPYVAQPLLGFGNGGSRDAGAGPAFTGFSIKTVTAAAGVAVGAAVETGFLNRSTRALVTGESVFGSSNTASPAVT